MKNLQHVDIRPQDETSHPFWQNLVLNVSYLYSKAARELHVKTQTIRRINVRFGEMDCEWDGRIIDNVADVYVTFDPGKIHISDPYQSQTYILGRVDYGMQKLARSGNLDSSICEKIKSIVVNSNFSCDEPLSKWIRAEEGDLRCRIVMRTAFDHNDLYIDLKRKNTQICFTQFLQMWASPWLPILNFRGAKFIGPQRLEINMYRPKFSVDQTKFGFRFYDLAHAEIKLATRLESDRYLLTGDVICYSDVTN